MSKFFKAYFQELFTLYIYFTYSIIISVLYTFILQQFYIKNP